MRLSIESAVQRVPLDINKDNLKALSDSLSLAETDLTDLKISIEDKYGISTYLSRDKKVTVLIKGELNALEKKKNILRRICENPGSNLSLVDKFVLNSNLYTRRLPQYLLTAPPERAAPFAEGILLNGASRAINQTLLHEMKHVGDVAKYPIMRGAHAAYNLFWIASGLGLSYIMSSTTVSPDSLPALIGATIGFSILNIPGAYMLGVILNPLEIRAKFFERRHKNTPEFRVISLQKS